MLGKFKGFSTDNHAYDALSNPLLNLDPSKEPDQAPMFIPSSFDPYISSLGDDFHANLMLKSRNQDKNQGFTNTKTFSYPITDISMNQKNLMFNLKGEDDGQMEADNAADEGNNTGGDSDSNSENGKRGKYKTYTDDEKNHIINFVMKHGFQKTMEVFSGGEHKITKRKLKSWVDGLNKIKGVKGRKSNDPARDQALFEWCTDFQNNQGRPPSRKEATQKALELNGDPTFMASKGWLDKFSRKYKIEFTPLKIIPPKVTKKVKTDTDSSSAASSVDSTNVSPLFPNSSLLKDIRPKNENESKPSIFMAMHEAKMEKEKEGFAVRGSLMKLGNPMYQQPHQQPSQPHQEQFQQQFTPHAQQYPYQQQLHMPQQQQNHQNPQMSFNNHETNISGQESNNMYQNPSSLDSQNFSYPMLNPQSFSLPQGLNYQGLPYSKGYPVSCRTPYPMSYQPNLPLNFQAGFAENLQQLQKIYNNESGKIEKH